MLRKIIHIDMDSFYASVEQRDFPQYRGKALVVGGRSPRSVVAAASYEAREYGIHSAMPMSVALRRCPHLIVQPHRFDVYTAVSKLIHSVFYEYTDLVEPLSLDEAYLDVTEALTGPPSASLIAKEIKRKIREKTGLVASAGVSYNKFLAKIASDMDKPDGFFLILPEEAPAFLEKLEIRRFHGVGKRTEEKMSELGIFKGGDLKKLSLSDCILHFGKAGRYFYDAVRGIDDRAVMPQRVRKSIGAERTFETDLQGYRELASALLPIFDTTWERAEKKEKKSRTLTLKCRFEDFSTLTRSRSKQHSYRRDEAWETLLELLEELQIAGRGIRLLGVTLSNFEQEDRDFEQGQLELDFLNPGSSNSE